MIKKKELKKKIAPKLREIREDLKLTHQQLAAHMGVDRSTYTKSETGVSAPGISSLYELSHSLNISLDWLICDKGSKYINEKEVPSSRSPEKTETIASHLIDKEQQELLEFMNQSPLFKHEILAFFLRFKESNPDLVVHHPEPRLAI